MSTNALTIRKIFLFNMAILAFLFINFCVSTYAEDLIGPKILNLQLGLPEQEATKIIVNISQKLGVPLVKEENGLKAGFYATIYYLNNKVTFFSFASQMFNTKNLTDKDILNKLSKEYGLNNLKPVNNKEFPAFKEDKKDYYVLIEPLGIAVGIK